MTAVPLKYSERLCRGIQILLPALAVICLNGCTAGRTSSLHPEGELLTPNAGSPERIGIALAGGGSKAASYAMGVLAAVADSEAGFDRVQAISSVSGGGYAAFFLYSKLLLREQDRNLPRPETRAYFADCIPHIYSKVLPHDADGNYTGTPPLCAAPCDSRGDGRFLFQQFVRCRQDVLENDCKQELEKDARDDYLTASLNVLWLCGWTGLIFTPNLVARSVFDWPVNLSPTRYAYREGIGTAYGLYPCRGSALKETSNLSISCNSDNFLNCQKRFGHAEMKRDQMSFSDLHALVAEGKGKIPIWYINATASRYRSVFGWAREGQRNFAQYTLAFSPFGASSGFYGPIRENDLQIDLLDAVTASAAFFDANEVVLDQPLRMAVAMSLHLGAFDWGIDIPNPNVHSAWRVLHSVLPVPFYYTDGFLRQVAGVEDNQHSAYIRLLDGGNNDNLGAFTLIEKGMNHIFISDHAQDNKGEMGDLCRLHNELFLREIHLSPGQNSGGHRHRLLIPGLEDFREHCKPFFRESEGGLEALEKDPVTLDKGRYKILNWTHPVLLGCILPDGRASHNCEGADVEARVYVIKPALDLKVFKERYLERVAEKTYRVRSEACSAQESGVCEVAAYLADWFNRIGNDDNVGAFPQDSTTKMTFASTGKRYGAYRELARWHMREALRMQQYDSATFAAEVKRQGENPIKRFRDPCPQL